MQPAHVVKVNTQSRVLLQRRPLREVSLNNPRLETPMTARFRKLPFENYSNLEPLRSRVLETSAMKLTYTPHWSPTETPPTTSTGTKKKKRGILERQLPEFFAPRYTAMLSFSRDCTLCWENKRRREVAAEKEDVVFWNWGGCYGCDEFLRFSGVAGSWVGIQRSATGGHGSV